MADRDEQLLDYLLGALEQAEQERLERQLDADPALRRRLKRLRGELGALRSPPPRFAAPPGLAARTCRFVFEHPRPAPRPIRRPLPQPLAQAAASSPPVARPSWTWADLVVAVGIFLAASLLVFPALESSRFKSRVIACQGNLRQVGVALVQYSQRNRGMFPQTPLNGPLAAAGIYAPTLVHEGYLPESQRLVCPESLLAVEPGFRVPRVEELLLAPTPERLSHLRARMGGSYGYSLGHVEGSQYYGPRNRGRAMFALLSDTPSVLPNHQSVNHGGRGQNVLFEDGHVRFYPSSQPQTLADDFFVNDTGEVAPGSHPDDSVIGPSDAAPAMLLP